MRCSTRGFFVLLVLMSLGQVRADLSEDLATPPPAATSVAPVEIPPGTPLPALVVSPVDLSMLPLKDPLLAAILSATMPGLGQIYSRRVLRGVAFLLGTAAPIIVAQVVTHRQRDDLQETFTIQDTAGAEHVISQQPREPDGDPAKLYSAMSGVERAVLVTGLGLGLGTWIWNVIDAMLVAEDYNRLFLETSLSVAPLPTDTALGLAVTAQW